MHPSTVGSEICEAVGAAGLGRKGLTEAIGVKEMMSCIMGSMSSDPVRFHFIVAHD